MTIALILVSSFRQQGVKFKRPYDNALEYVSGLQDKKYSLSVWMVLENTIVKLFQYLNESKKYPLNSLQHTLCREIEKLSALFRKCCTPEIG